MDASKNVFKRRKVGQEHSITELVARFTNKIFKNVETSIINIFGFGFTLMYLQHIKFRANLTA